MGNRQEIVYKQYPSKGLKRKFKRVYKTPESNPFFKFNGMKEDEIFKKIAISPLPVLEKDKQQPFFNQRRRKKPN